MVFKACNKIKNSDYEKEKYEQKIVVVNHAFTEKMRTIISDTAKQYGMDTYFYEKMQMHWKIWSMQRSPSEKVQI